MVIALVTILSTVLISTLGYIVYKLEYFDKKIDFIYKDLSDKIKK